MGARPATRERGPPSMPERPRPFQSGLADEREFPHDALEPPSAARGAKRAVCAGIKPSTIRRCRKPCCGHLAVHRGIKAKPAQILIVPTAQAGIDAGRRRAARIAAITPGSKAPAMAAPTSHCGPRGAIVSAIPLDDTRHGRRPRASDAPRLIFVTPSHQYPTGRLMPIGRRLELLRFAEAAGACIIEGRL